MMKKLCQSERSIRERELRRQKGENRRFNDPMKIFIQRKYPEIFKEYTEFYNFMEAEDPNRRNFTTSKTFRKWMTENPIKESTPTQAMPSTGQSLSTQPLLFPQLALEPVDFPSKVQEAPANVLTQALQETLAQGAVGHHCTSRHR